MAVAGTSRLVEVFGANNTNEWLDAFRWLVGPYANPGTLQSSTRRAESGLARRLPKYLPYLVYILTCTIETLSRVRVQQYNSTSALIDSSAPATCMHHIPGLLLTLASCLYPNAPLFPNL